MRRSAKSRQTMSQSTIAIMADAIKAKEQNLSYGKFKALDLMGAGSMSELQYSTDYEVRSSVLVRNIHPTEEKKAVAFVKIRA